jgi:hypothetical protein
MVTDPFATAVTSPLGFTVATFASDDDHVNVLPVIAFPLASRAVALSCSVSPSETSVPDAGVTWTEATLGVGGGGSVVSPPQAMRQKQKGSAVRKHKTERMDTSLVFSLLSVDGPAVSSSGVRPTVA